MFHVGRYDPRAVEQKERKRESDNKTIEKKRGTRDKKERSKKKRRRTKDDAASEHSQRKPNIYDDKRAAVTGIRHGNKESQQLDGDQSSSSDARAGTGVEHGLSIASRNIRDEESYSSSSVPSSTDDESDIDEPKTKSGKPMFVIAPEQKPAGGTNKKRQETTDEAFDDFDVDDEVIEESKEPTGNADSSLKTVSTAQGNQSSVPDEISTALYMSSLPIKEAASAWDLAPFLIHNLERDRYKTFFPIQSLVIPDVIASERHSQIRSRDICVSAPTGSGKTLAFVLPVLNALSKRRIRRLRALVILPSRDLAIQVYKVFDRYTRGSDLRVGLAIGQSDFKAEQEALTVGPPHLSNAGDIDIARQRYLFNPGNIELALEAFPGIMNAEAPSVTGTSSMPKGGRSAVDVLVATPGRLMDHLDKTPGFSLQHLRFLVIDEADRLVTQSYHNWIRRVVNATNEASINAWNEMDDERRKGSTMKRMVNPLKAAPDGNSFIIDPITWRRGGAGGDDSVFNNNDGYSSVVASVCRPIQLRKLLYSATLTKDPQKLSALGLVNAKHFDAHNLNAGASNKCGERSSQQRYSMPPGLSEYTVECTAEQKPLVLLALVLEQMTSCAEKTAASKGIVVVFTSSLDSTHRLVRLLQLLWSAAGYGPQEAVAEFSSALNQKQRSSLMTRCNAADSDVSIVVCSDGMSRGMDIPSVSTVINYDVPSFAKTYVHRCGRTARAGRVGVAISLLKGGQVGQFFKMRRLIDFPDGVTSMGIKKELVHRAVPSYRMCVKVLREVIDVEKDGELGTVDAIPEDWIPSRMCQVKVRPESTDTNDENR